MWERLQRIGWENKRKGSSEWNETGVTGYVRQEQKGERKGKRIEEERQVNTE